MKQVKIFKQPYAVGKNHFIIIYFIKLFKKLLKRPLNERELKLNSIQVIECREKGKEILAVDKNSPVPTTKTFTFDRVIISF